MEKKYIYILYIISVLFFSSCADDLNIAPQGLISDKEIFSDNDKVSAYLNSCYDNLPTKGLGYFNVCRGPVVWSDEAWDANLLTISNDPTALFINGSSSASRYPIIDISGGDDWNYWERYWGSIRTCTKFLTKVNAATIKDEKDRKRWTAEAHLLRAFYYSELLKWYGTGLPIEREEFDFTSNFKDVKRSSYHDVVKFIIEDCDAALNTTELPWRIVDDYEAGRVTKAMAEAIKSRMILYAASPLYCEGKNNWEEAYKINKASLQNLRNNGYDLYKTINYPQTYLSPDAFLPNEGAALYNEYFNQVMSYSPNPVDRETIFQCKNLSFADQIWNVDGIGCQHGGTFPTQELVDAYETKNGMPILNLEKPYKDEEHRQPNLNLDNTMYDEKNPYENRDPRFYASIYYNGSKRNSYWEFDEPAECFENYPASQGTRTRIIATWVGEPETGLSNDNYATRTGYYMRKFLHPFAGADNPISGANFKMFRLGEVILNFAEAAAEYNQLDEARDAVNEIRRRVGMPDLPTGLNKDELILRIKNERRVELAMEEDRFFDIRRWQNPSGDLSATEKWVTAMEIHPDGNGGYTYTRRPVRNTERKCYSNKFLKAPIPMNEVNRMKTATGENWQNPGW
ncbi:MAG: RagB/SusD family nutrient uptake outer membrane protein [Bacteroidota bacterium]|nr:RagB/SusD family nutrient uptake outer membrane protein [Bacteroidota bacterium]